MDQTPNVKLPSHVPLDAPYVDLTRAWTNNKTVMLALRRYDAALVVFYHRNINRWVVGRTGRDARVRLVMVWQDAAGGYLPLDDRLVHGLAQMDMRPNRLDAARTANEEADRRDAADDARAERADKTFDDDVTHLTRENERYLRKVIARTLNA